MDPLSIVASSTALLMTCSKAAYLLHNFISSTKDVHATVTTLHADITSLSELLEDLRSLFARSEIVDVVDVEMDNYGGRVWKRAGGILESVRMTLLAVEVLVEKVEGRRKGKGKEKENEEVGKRKLAFVKRGWMQLKLEFRAGDFELRHRQLQTQRSTLQIFLASITLCLQVHAESEQAAATENILASIAALKEDVKGLDLVNVRKRLDESTKERLYYDHPGNYVATNNTVSDPLNDQLDNVSNLEAENSAEQIEAETKVMVDQLEDTLESAKEVIQSAQASIASYRAGSVRSNASVAVSEQGSLFNMAARHRVGDWVVGNVIEEESSSDSDQGGDQQVMDLESIISQRLQDKGDGYFELQQFAEAEDVFRLSLRHYEKATTKTDSHRAELKLKLALARVKQKKWDNIEELLSPLLESSVEETTSSDVLTAWHLLAEQKLNLGLLNEAEKICRQVTERRRTLLRKRDPAQEESMELFVQISQAKSTKLKEKADELLFYGIDINSSSYDGNAELRKAALTGTNIKLLELLLSLPDVDIDSPCENGLTAVAYAWVSKAGHSYPFLVERNADTSLVSDDSLTEWWEYFDKIPVCVLKYDEDFKTVENTFQGIKELFKGPVDWRPRLDNVIILCRQINVDLESTNGMAVAARSISFSSLLNTFHSVNVVFGQIWEKIDLTLLKINAQSGKNLVSNLDISERGTHQKAFEGLVNLLKRLQLIMKATLDEFEELGLEKRLVSIISKPIDRHDPCEDTVLLVSELQILLLTYAHEEMETLTSLFFNSSKIFADGWPVEPIHPKEAFIAHGTEMRQQIALEVLKTYVSFEATTAEIFSRRDEPRAALEEKGIDFESFTFRSEEGTPLTGERPKRTFFRDEAEGTDVAGI